MARRLRGDLGGIAGLRRLIADHKEALEYDLIALGLRFDWLGTEALSWRDLLVIVRQSPQSSALSRSLHGTDAMWDLHAHLLAANADSAALAVWMQSTDAQKGRNRPERIPRPGVEPPREVSQVGSGALSIEEMDEWLKMSAPPQVEEPPPVAEAMPDLVEKEHDLGIAGHEVDCPICQAHDRHTTRAVLIPAQVRDIRTLADHGVKAMALADQFGVSSSTIAAIIARRTWKNVN